MFVPPLGFILPEDRTPEQEAAHEKACAGIPRFTSLPNAAALLRSAEIPIGTKVMLTDTWKHPDVIADIGQEFTGFGQYDGSCVGVSTGNGVSTISFIQRLIADAPTKAMVMFWPFNYGRLRVREGDRGPGEGAVVSMMDECLVEEGFFDISLPGLPSFRWDADGIWIEGGRNKERSLSYLPHPDPEWVAAAAPNKGLTRTDISSVDQMIASIINGCPVLNGCSMFPGGGTVVSRAGGSYVRGRYDTRGGHATMRCAVWHHPNDGILIGYSNQWPTSVYPKDPAGLGRCCVWMTIAEEERMLRQLGGSRGETYAISHVPGIPIQPKVLDMFIAP